MTTNNQFDNHAKTVPFFAKLKSALSAAVIDEHGKLDMAEKGNLMHVIFRGEKGKAVCAFFVSPDGNVEMYKNQEQGGQTMGVLTDTKSLWAVAQECRQSVMEVISEAIDYEATLAANLKSAIADLHRRPR